ncbi:MAG: hypothetical protein Q4C65_03605 [Eubacteriales bacterium]|nr:hypothetical protein [Eubacteriales bacterium]
MKRDVLAICDPEQEYAYRLVDALGSRSDFPFEILAFTSVDKLYGSLAEKPVQILLIAQPAFREEMRSWPVPRIILLQEEEAPSDESLACVCKYTSVLRIMKKITEVAMEAGKLPPVVQTDHRVRIYGMYTPVGRSLQTTFALSMGQLLAKTRRTLYVNLECCSGLADMLGQRPEGELSRLLYYLQEPPGQFLNRLYQAAERINGLDMTPLAASGYDLYGMGREEWQHFLDALTGSRYESVILDLSDGLQGLFDILRRCTRIYTIVREDAFAAAKLGQYETALREAEYGDVLERTRRVRLPAFSQLPRDLNHLCSGELADFIGKVLETDERGGI